MTEHLRSEHFVEALEDALDASRRVHLADCERCQAELASLRAVWHEAARVEAPAPSPLFWDHFSARVRSATAGESVPAARAWWEAWWRPIGALSSAIGVIALLVVLRPPAPVVPAVPTANAGSAVETMADDGSWSLIVGLASELKVADVKEAAEPAAGTADAMIDELTPAQRAALVRLLQKEMGEL